MRRASRTYDSHGGQFNSSSLFLRNSEAGGSTPYSSSGLLPNSRYHLPDPTQLVIQRRSSTTCPSANKLQPEVDEDPRSNKILREFFSRPDHKERENATPLGRVTRDYSDPYQKYNKTSNNSPIGAVNVPPVSLYSMSHTNIRLPPLRDSAGPIFGSPDALSERKESYGSHGNNSSHNSEYIMSSLSDGRVQDASNKQRLFSSTARGMSPCDPISPSQHGGNWEEYLSSTPRTVICDTGIESRKVKGTTNTHPLSHPSSAESKHYFTAEKDLYNDQALSGQVGGSNEGSFRCRDCNRKCKSEGSLLRHATSCTHARGPLSLECRYCKRPYTYLGYLYKHETECARTFMPFKNE